MPNFKGEIKDFVAGDDLEVTRTITNVPAGASLTRAWLTVKDKRDDADADAIFQKEITVADVAGTGQITDPGSGTFPNRVAAVRFDLGQADTLKLTQGIKYLYDIQVLTDASAIYTPEIGTIIAKLGTTVDTS